MTTQKRRAPEPQEEWTVGKVMMVIAGLLIGAVMAMAHCDSGGTYDGGEGSSHKGGHYHNDSTDNHYRKR